MLVPSTPRWDIRVSAIFRIRRLVADPSPGPSAPGCSVWPLPLVRMSRAIFSPILRPLVTGARKSCIHLLSRRMLPVRTPGAAHSVRRGGQTRTRRPDTTPAREPVRPRLPNDRLLYMTRESGSAPDAPKNRGSPGEMPGINSTAGYEAVPFDPFELKDVVSGNIRDPYPRLRELLRESRCTPARSISARAPTLADPNVPAPVTVFGFDEVVSVLRDNETYSSSVYEGVMGMVMGRTILQMDEPEHRSVRALVAGSFRSKMLERWEEDLVALVVNELIDAFADRGRSDLVRDVTFNFPVQVIARILGLPREDYPRFQRWALEITSVAANWDRGIAASAALRDYFVDVMAERRATPGDDLISDLVRAEVDGKHLDDEEICSFLRLLLPAGVETTYRASGSLLLALLNDRTQFDALYGDRSLFAQAFEEALRWEPPVTVILRRATRDTELAGVAIEKGADIGLLIGAANRDERKYTDPDTYDMFRAQRQHVGFGFGVHVCLGMHLARMESRVAINTLFDRLGPFTLDPDAVPPHIEGLAFRSPLSLPVVFQAR